MDNIQQDILAVFNKNHSTIYNESGWLMGRIFQCLLNKNNQQKELANAFSKLAELKYIEEYDTYYRKLTPKPPDIHLPIQNLYNRKAPDAIQHIYCIITELGREKYLESIQPKKVFIIHGHDEARYLELKLLLGQEFSLDAIELAEQASEGATLIEKFEYYAKQCTYAFAIFTPDDIVINGEERYFQARPNVIFELGWFIGHLGRGKVCILYQDSKENSIFTDYSGVAQIRFYKKNEEVNMPIRRELVKSGIIV